MRWELEALGGGTRLTLWTNIGRRFISMGAAGWHICFDVLERLLAGEPIGRIVGLEAMKFGWQRLPRSTASCSVSRRPTGRLRKGGQINHERSHQTFDFSMDSHYLWHSDNRLQL
jgi:hypothetical protein